ncbi:MAG: hypothetical protein EAZ15_02305 [Sphingobacteriales bacterium]|nr:MAG: hypothetical protein EAZ15_02305 [Sphingobacteriales bacterium]
MAPNHLFFFKLKYHITLMLVLYLFFYKSAIAQNQFVFKYPHYREQIACKKVRELLIVTAYLNNKGPFNLVLDTGVGLFLVTDPSLRTLLNIPQTRKITISGLGVNPDIDAYVTPAIKVEIGNTIAPTLPAAILDEDVFDLSAFAGIPIHGLIGYDFFNSFTTQIFYPTATLVVFNNGKQKISKRYHKIPITLENNKPYCTINAQTIDKNKYDLKTLIDLGSGNAVSLETFNNQPFPLPNIYLKANLGVGLSGDINGNIGRLKSITIGKQVINNPICAFPNFSDVGSKAISTPRNGSIGSQLLKKFNVIFDYRNSFMYLKPNLNFSLALEHDMSGLELFVGGDDLNRIFVNRVEENSPADLLGMVKNDELTSINFKKAADMGIDEIISLFQSANDKNIYLEYMHKDVLNRVILTLKRRI